MRGNLDRLRQMLINLLLNAIEAAAQGRAQNNLPADVVLEVTGQPPNRLILSVTDSGPGPAESVRGQLFEPFVTEEPDGVGLGLSVVRCDVAREHGGQIDLQRTGDLTALKLRFRRSTRRRGRRASSWQVAHKIDRRCPRRVNFTSR